MDNQVISALFLDIGGVLLTNGWDHTARRQAAQAFHLDYDELEERHHLSFDTYEEGKYSLDEYLQQVVFNLPRSFTLKDFKSFMLSRSRPFPDMLDLVQSIKRNNAGIRNVPGTQIVNTATGEAIFTPPEGEALIRDKLKNLEDYIQDKDGPDPMIKLAIIHYQFESIHPFFDGNGRAGRILNILYLVQQNLLELPVLYLSRYLIQRKSDYYRLLRGVTEDDQWEPWILYMLEAIEETATFTRERILAIRKLMLETMDQVKKDLPGRVYSKELIELLFRQPYTKNRFLVEKGIAQRKTAAEYLKALEKIGVLESRKIGKEVLYLNVKLYELLSSEHV